MEDFEPTWLCRDPPERARLLDMEARLAPARRTTFGVLAASLLLAGPWVGFWTLAPLAVGVAGYLAADRGLRCARRPEYRIALAWTLVQVALGASILLTGGIDSPALAWLAVPVVALPARFSTRPVVIGCALTIAIMVATSLAAGPGAIIDNPVPLLFAVPMVCAVALLASALMRSDRDHRAAAVIDPLTGLLNRNALGSRVGEVGRQLDETTATVSVIAADLDHFKPINDAHGHAVGDAVLREIATALSHALRGNDVVYRVGGEEFIVLLAGADTQEASLVAERLREIVTELRPGGLRVTMSLGVASASGPDVDFDGLFAEADAALYLAKAHGRNQVVEASGPAVLATA